MVLLVLAFVLAADDGGVALNAPVTRKNWEAHPKVVPSRMVVTEVNDALATKKLEVREFVDCTDEFSNYTVATDSKLQVLQLVRDFGGGDSSHHAELFYDSAGRVRFLFVRVGAVPSAWVEARFWLDETGVVVWSTRQSGGEGPTYYARDIDDYLVRSPVRFLRARTSCDAG